MNRIQIFEPNLTAENAEENGYEYINDVFYDINHIDANFQHLLHFVLTYDCKLGTPVKPIKFTFGLFIERDKITEEVLNVMESAKFINLKEYNNRKLKKLKEELEEIVE